jgi:ATP-dependent phosphofructokinase / diphosphate-dependent phosphofructokinase
MSAGNKIGILTGGGDVPGLNLVIKSVTYGAGALNREVIGIRRGWEGITYLSGPDDPNYILPLNRDNTRTIDRTGGTMLHTSRTNPRKTTEAKLAPQHQAAVKSGKIKFDGKYYDLTPIVIENLEKLGIGCLVAIGGDDTLSFASALSKAGFPVVAVPKTMDNDVQGTEYCIGFSTAITRARDAINRQRTTIGSHERIGIFRIFGRDAGFTALYTAYVTYSRCLIPEYNFDIERLCKLLMEDKRENSSRYALVIASEGAMWTGGEIKEYGEADAFGHRKKADIGQMLDQEIRKRTGQETIVSDLTYDLRGGEPDVTDQMVGIGFGNIALELIAAGASGRMTAIEKGCFTNIPIPDASLGARHIDVAKFYDTQGYTPSYASKQALPLFFTGY